MQLNHETLCARYTLRVGRVQGAVADVLDSGTEAEGGAITWLDDQLLRAVNIANMDLQQEYYQVHGVTPHRSKMVAEAQSPWPVREGLQEVAAAGTRLCRPGMLTDVFRA